MVLTGHALADGRLHQTRQRWQHVDWWVDLSVVQLTIDVDLALGNVTGQIGNGMGNIIVRHGQNGDLGDGSVASLHTTGTLVDGGQIGVHVTGETTTTGHLLTGSRHLTQSLGVRGHVGKDDEHVLLALVGQELGGSQSQAGSDDTLDGRIVGQVQEQTHVLHGTVLLEVLLEESGSLHVHTHSGEHDGEVVGVVIQHGLARQLDETGLTTDLGGDFVVGQTGGGEDGDLLATGNRVHHIDGRDTGLDHLLGVDTRPGVDGLALDVQEILSQNWGSLVDGLAGTVEHTAQHILRHGRAQNVAGELAKRVLGIDARGALEHLDHGLGAAHLEHLSGAHSTVSQTQLHDLGELGELDLIENDQGTVHTRHSLVSCGRRRVK